jgi:hypothetical protein
MKPLHWVIAVFWIFVGAMIIKQCHDDTASREVAAEKAPQQYFFHQPTGPQIAPPPPPSPDADVEQVDFVVHPDTPSQGNFTCDVTLKNLGSKTATAIQVSVRPFRGGSFGDNNVGHAASGFISDNDPLAQLASWVAFPDLAPGQQSTQSVIFLNQVGIKPGSNPHPEIDFQTAKTPSNP